MCPHVAIVVRLLHIGQYLAHGLFLEMGACLYRYSFALFPGDAVPGATFANTNVAGKFRCRELPFAGAWFWEKIPGPISVLNVTRWKNWRNFV